MELQEIKTVREFNDPKMANTFLQHGWILLGVHQQGFQFDGPNGPEASHSTVYIVGTSKAIPSEQASIEDLDDIPF